MVDHLVAVARHRGVARVSLETGAPAAFASARQLYERAGFEAGEPYGSYTNSGCSVCMTMLITESQADSQTRRGG